jgi:hypothetical protein
MIRITLMRIRLRLEQLLQTFLFRKEQENVYSEWKKMQKMGKGMFNLKKNDDNTLQTDGLDHRGFHLPHHILIKERTLQMYFYNRGKHFEKEYRLMSFEKMSNRVHFFLLPIFKKRKKY